jgi:hypothetical protein
MFLTEIIKQAKNNIGLNKFAIIDGYNIDHAAQAIESFFDEHKGYEDCSAESRQQAIADALIQGLNPLEGHCEFVQAGQTLHLVRKPSGSIIVAQRVKRDLRDIRGQVIREGEIFEVEVVNGYKTIKKHGLSLTSYNQPITGAYAVALNSKGLIEEMDMLSWLDILDIWHDARMQIKNEPIVRKDGTLHPASDHARMPAQKAIETVIEHLCRAIIATCPDEQLLMAAQRCDAGNFSGEKLIEKK